MNKFAVYAEFSVVGVAKAVVDLGTLNLLLWLWPTAGGLRCSRGGAKEIPALSADSRLVSHLNV
jgi:hypothetical protein